MAKHEIIQLEAPVGGQNKAAGVQQKAPFFFEDGLNVRAFDVFEMRGRIGSRPGQVKTFAQQLGLPVPVQSFAQSFTVLRDSGITSNPPNDTNETFNIQVGKFGTATYRGLFYFDVSSIPAGANIVSATLKITVFARIGSDGQTLCTVNRVTNNNWTEAFATWNSYSFGNAWIVPGGDYVTTDSASFVMVENGVWAQQIDISALVLDAISNRSGILNLLIKKDVETGSSLINFTNLQDPNQGPGYNPGDLPATVDVAYETGGPVGATDSTEIRLMAVCRTLEDTTAATTFSDPFDDDPLDPTDWPSSGGWTINGIATSGLPTILLGNAASLTADQLRSAALADQVISTAVAREVSITPVDMKIGTEVNLFMDMDNTTPQNFTSIRLLAAILTGNLWDLRLYINGSLVGSAATAVSEPAVGSQTIRLSIDASNTIRAYWSSATSYSIIYTPSGYIPAGGRVGFALQNNAAGDGVLVSQFNFSYQPSAGANPQSMLMASANGYLYKETTAGEIVLVSSDLTLRRDRLLSAINRLQKLFIADYELMIEGTDGSTTGSTFDDVIGTDWAALSVGAEAIVNGTFAADTDWTKGTGWTIAAGVATATGAISTDLSQTVGPLTVGQEYRVVYTITRTAGGITPVCGTSSGLERTSSNTFADDIICTSTTGFRFTTSGFTGTVDNVSAFPILSQVNVNDHRLEITDLTDAPGSVNNVSGVYGITGVSSASLTITPVPVSNRSGLTYRIVRGPKVYDAATNQLTMLGLGTIGVSQFPVGFRHFSLWADRIVATNDAAKPHQWQMSAQQFPLLWNFGDNETVGENGLTSDAFKLTLGVGAAVSDAVAVNSGLLGEPIVCTIPINDTYLIFACRNSFHVLRGNPKIDGQFIALSRDVGILDIGAHVRTPDGRILVMTLDGLYEVTLQGVTVMSRDVLPQELTAIDAERYEVTLGYDFPRRGICISAVARDLDIDPTLPAIYYFYDLRTGGYFPDTYQADHDPTATVAHQVGGLGEQVLLRGCRDGYIRQFSDQAPHDDYYPFFSYAFYGPIRLGAGEYGDGILHEVVDVLDANSGDITLRAYVGHSAQAARAATPRWETIMSAGRNRNRWPRLRGGTLYLITDGTPGFAWARESLTITREQLGKLRTTT